MVSQKVEVVINWPLHSTVKQVQYFGGFAKFYRRFVRDFSSVAAPWTALTKGSAGHVSWNSAAERGFQELKLRFSPAPILVYADPSLPFEVEVDASDFGMDAVLSLR
jgi:hypothetical protein